MLAPLAEGTTTVLGLLDSEDVRATERAMRQAGAAIRSGAAGEWKIEGPIAWEEPGIIDCGNSGTTARLLLGLLAGAGLPAVLKGDESLSRRPMDRVVYPLQAMGARIRYLGPEGCLPIELEARRSGSLRPLRHRPRIASAQVKSSLLLASLTSGVRVEVDEPARTRDHTERLLGALGVTVESRPGPEGAARVRLDPTGRAPVLPPNIEVPGDFSSAAFLLAASWLGAGPVEARDVGLNPRRTGLLRVADEIGAPYEVQRAVEPADRGSGASVAGPEPTGTLRAWSGRLRSFEVDGRLLPDLLDEIPVLAVLAARASGVSRIREAEELRRKESDRLAVLATNLKTIGVSCREQADGLEIVGTNRPLAGSVRPAGDHRIAMAFGALSVSPDCNLSIEERECVSVSYPGFWRDLERIARPEAA